MRNRIIAAAIAFAALSGGIGATIAATAGTATPAAAAPHTWVRT